MKNAILIIGFLSMGSCAIDDFQNNEVVQLPQYENVDQRLWPLFQEFEEEAKKRGLFVDLNALEVSGTIKNIPDQNVAGTCQYGSHITHVTVDQSYWNNGSANYKEFIVFHELGHCVLHRSHDEGSFSNGVCKSIMQSGTGTCRSAYNLQNREYYIDELFSNI
ncbi:MAG: hypothetical protein KJN84_17225 [Bacteroidia bacterium]|nr:hypothetical protein [Bacteroidia bacterium]